MAEEIMEESMKEQGGISEQAAASMIENEKAESVSEQFAEQPEQKIEKAEAKFDNILSKVSAAASTQGDDDVAHDTKHVGETQDEEGKIRKLLDLAGTKGVPHAVKVARSLSDYYALDRMHDELADRLYQGLIEKGLISKE